MTPEEIEAKLTEAARAVRSNALDMKQALAGYARFGVKRWNLEAEIRTLERIEEAETKARGEVRMLRLFSSGKTPLKTKQELNLFRKVLHEDNSATREDRAKAMQILNDREEIFFKEPPPPREYSAPIPRDPAEWTLKTKRAGRWKR